MSDRRIQVIAWKIICWACNELENLWNHQFFKILVAGKNHNEVEFALEFGKFYPVPNQFSGTIIRPPWIWKSAALAISAVGMWKSWVVCLRLKKPLLFLIYLLALDMRCSWQIQKWWIGEVYALSKFKFACTCHCLTNAKTGSLSDPILEYGVLPKWRPLLNPSRGNSGRANEFSEKNRNPNVWFLGLLGLTPASSPSPSNEIQGIFTSENLCSDAKFDNLYPPKRQTCSTC